MTQQPRGKARIRQFYAERGSSAQASAASTHQQEKPETGKEVRGAEKIRQLYNRPEGDDSA